MSSKWMRLGALAGSAALLAGAIARAQDRNAGRAAGRGTADVFVFNPVEGRITVLSSQPDGARVEKGAVVCELDAADLQDRLINQKIIVASAEAEFQNAQLALEVAEIAVAEYKQGSFVQEYATVEGEIKLAESDLLRAEEVLDWSRRMYDKGYQSKVALVADELKFKKIQFALEQAQSKRKVLVDYTKHRMVKELAGAVQTAKARELAKQAALERERSALKRMGNPFQHSKIVAPVGGRVHYLAPMGVGAVLHDGQAIFRIELDSEFGAPAK
jgi:multidrug resistance efflux pump